MRLARGAEHYESPPCTPDWQAPPSDANAPSTLPTESPAPVDEPEEPEDDADRVPVVGTRVAERFRLTRVLGSGGMGVVFEAEDDLYGEIVALKWLRKRRRMDVLLREFRALSGLSHQNLTEYFECFVDARSAFVTMERIEGVRLDQYLRARSTWADFDEHVVDAFRQLAAALGFLHASGIVHCDLKPANVLVEASGRVRVVDFGLAQHDRVVPHRFLGTPGYAAPEVKKGRRHGAAADWYSFGVMLSEALAHAPRAVAATRAPASELPRLCAALTAADASARPGYAEVARALNLTDHALVRPERPFVGRTAELVALRNAYAECASGGARWVDVRGPSGIGKTRLVTELIRELEQLEHPPLTCWSTVYEREFVPFRALARFLSALALWRRADPAMLSDEDAQTLAQLLSRRAPDGAAPAEADEAREWHRTPKVLSRLIAALTQKTPIVLVLDQLHGGDRESAELLLAALRHEPRARVLIVAICRSDARHESEFLNAADRHAAFLPRTRLDVGALSHEQMLELLAPHTGFRDRIAAQANGVPWLALELAHDAAENRELANPERLVERRLLGLSAGAQRLAKLLAIAGRPISLATARAALEPAPPEPADVRCLIKERLVRETPRRTLAINYDLVAKAIRGMISQADARALHAALATALLAAAAPDHAAIADHFFAADRPREAVPHAFEAANRAAASRAFGARILDSGVLSEPDATRCRRRLAEALSRAGRGAEAGRQYELLASAESGLDAQRDSCRAVEQYLTSGHAHVGLLQLDRLAREVGVTRAEQRAAVIARLAWERLQLGYRGLGFVERSRDRADQEILLQMEVAAAGRTGNMLVNPLRGALYSAVGLRLALQSGVSDEICRCLCYEILIRSNEGMQSACIVDPMLSLARTLGARSTNPEVRALVQFADGAARLLCGQFGEGAALLGDAMRGLEIGVHSWELTLCRLLWMTALEFHGPLQDAPSLLERWLADAGARRDLMATRFFSRRRLAHLAADDVAAVAGAATTESGSSYDHAEVSAVRQRASLALYLDAPAGKLVGLHPALERFFRTPMRRSQGLRVAIRTALAGIELQILARGGSRDAGRRRVRSAIRKLSKERSTYAQACAWGLTAALRHQNGDRRGAVEALEATREAAERCEMRYLAAAALLRQSQILGGAGAGKRARTAVEMLQGLGVKRPSSYARTLLPGFVERSLGLDPVGLDRGAL